MIIKGKDRALLFHCFSGGKSHRDPITLSPEVSTIIHAVNDIVVVGIEERSYIRYCNRFGM